MPLPEPTTATPSPTILELIEKGAYALVAAITAVWGRHAWDKRKGTGNGGGLERALAAHVQEHHGPLNTQLADVTARLGAVERSQERDHRELMDAIERLGDRVDKRCDAITVRLDAALRD